MTIPFQNFVKAGVDIGAGITEAFLNRFAVAHFKDATSAYSGTVEITEFDQKLTVDYAAKNPLVFDLAPISKKRFAKIWLAHLEAINRNTVNINESAVVPPNVQVTTDKLEFVFTVFKKDGSADFKVPFKWDLKATCAVVLDDGPGDTKAIHLDPIKVTFSQPASFIAQQIREELLRVRKIRNPQPQPEGPSDVNWCIKLEKLFIFVLNQILSRQLASFIGGIELPRAIELVDGMRISPFMLEVVADSLLVGARVLPARGLNSDLTTKLNAVMLEFEKRYTNEFLSSDFRVSDWKKDSSPTFQWLEERINEAEAEAKAYSRRPAGGRVPENVYILTNHRLYDQLARTYLNLFRSEEKQTPEYSGFRAVAGYWLQIQRASGGVVPGGINVSAEFAAHGHAGIQVRNIWNPKHWGRWEDLVDLCVDAVADPKFEIEAFPAFKNNGIFLHLLLKNPNRIKTTWCSDVPGKIAGDLLAFILTLLSELILAVIKLFIAAFLFKIVSYPPNFPGTPIKWEPNMNGNATNNGPYLTFSGDPKFK